MKFGKVALSICIALVSGTAFSQNSQPKPEDIIKFRQSGMMFMRWNMGVIKKQVANNPAHFNREKVIRAATTLSAISNSGIEALFTSQTSSGTGWKKTRVKPGYFEQAEKTKSLYVALKRETDALSRIANEGTAKDIKTQFTRVFNACKSCHKKYRAK